MADGRESAICIKEGASSIWIETHQAAAHGTQLSDQAALYRQWPQKRPSITEVPVVESMCFLFQGTNAAYQSVTHQCRPRSRSVSGQGVLSRGDRGSNICKDAGVMVIGDRKLRVRQAGLPSHTARCPSCLFSVPRLTIGEKM